MNTRNEDDINEETADHLTGIICFSDARTTYDHEMAEQTFMTMLKIPELKPVLEIAAKLGKYDFHFAQNNRLMIMMDPYHNDIENMCFGLRTGLIGYRDNVIYIAIGQESKDLEESKEIVRGRLLYAITQYVMNKVFNNQYQPFRHDDIVNQKQYADACKSILGERKNNKLADDVFGKIDQKFQTHMIAQIPVLTWYDRGTQGVEKQYPELLAYYQNTVLPACKHYSQELDIQFQRRMEEELAARSSLRM